MNMLNSKRTPAEHSPHRFFLVDGRVATVPPSPRAPAEVQRAHGAAERP
jgi:hypothetical protein